MIVKPIKTSIFNEGENLFVFITRHLKKVKEKSIIVVTSKIVALAEKRTVAIKSKETKKLLISQESELAIPTKYAWLTIKNGIFLASAGIDESNAKGKLILLPKNTFKTASLLHKKLKEKYSLKDLGILIVDSRSLPLRAGISGVALGYAGFHGLRDYRGKPDIFGRKFKFSRSNLSDSLAAAAVLTMGEGSEQQPLAVIEKAPIEFCEKINQKELAVDIKEDMYYSFFSKLSDIDY